MYPIIPQHIPQERRAEINEKILFAIETGKGELPPENVYNCYTGIGGLHDLKREDFDNYNEYSRAKKEIEMGQFFTPHEICRDMVGMLAPTETELVADMCCGMGNFFNWLPNRHNAHGFDIDSKAVSVARYLYPDTKLQTCDIEQYRPDVRFDCVIGNPPFNLKIGGRLSQFYYIRRAYEVLNPAGLLMIIVPQSFLVKEFWEKAKVTDINRDFSFIGQSKLHPNAFASVGVINFETKIMVFMRESKHIEMKPYREDEFVSTEVLGRRIAEARELKTKLRVQLMRETSSIDKDELDRFEYKLAKYLYELKTHKNLQKQHKKAQALVTRFRNQRPPDNATAEEIKRWETNKLTTDKVLKRIYDYIRNQDYVPRKEVRLVKYQYGYKLKQYAPRLIAGIGTQWTAMYDLVLGNADLPPEPANNCVGYAKAYREAQKLIARKQHEYENQSQKFSEMEPDPEIDRYLDSATFINKEYEVCRFTPLQLSDLNLIIQKRYSLLNWQQGSGKTAAVYHRAKYLMKFGHVRNVVVLAPAIATNLTWEAFLKANREEYYTIQKRSDLENIPHGAFLIVSVSMLDKLKKPLQRFMKMQSQRVCLIFDESDEITNPNAERTIATLSAFRRTRYKVLATGTTTRNYIIELYSQIELLYNNSVNMICDCPTVYYQDRESKEIYPRENSYIGMPFPAHEGHNLFKACYCPGKASVFGIEKQNQDIYNKDSLTELIAKTIITRKFREFAGDKYEIRTHSVQPSKGEFEVYRVIMEEFCRIYEKYFNNTGDAKKEAALKIMRQIKLLIKACSVPNMIDGYYGDKYPSKVSYIADLIKSIPGKVAVGCTELATLSMYQEYIEEYFPDRPIFVIQGAVSFKRRQAIIKQFEDTINGILICTQQSLKSSANIPSCDDVILESLQWNIPKMEQFYFRFIRLDAINDTQVHFVSYLDSIEQNLMALVLTKERLNEFIKNLEVTEQSEIFEEFDISMSVIESLLIKTQDSEGKVRVSWGSQRIAA